MQKTLKLISHSLYEGFMFRAVILSNYTARMRQLSLASSMELYGILLALEKCPCISYNVIIETEMKSSKLSSGQILASTESQ